MMNRLRSSDGYAIATAMIVMSIMLTVGIASYAFVDTETESSRRERVHESRLNLTEGVIAAEIFQMSRSWPSTSAEAFPAECTQASSAPLCPTPAQLKAQFTGVDIKLDTSWNVKVRDDADGATGKYYDDATVLGRPTWDQNTNGEMWVRAQGLLDGQDRVVVARVRVERKPLQFPDGPFVAGSFATGNSGNKIIVSTGGKNGIVRCDNGTEPPSYQNNTCIGYDSGQVSPVGTVVSDPNTSLNIIPPGMLDSLRAMAQSKGTYYPSGCPANPSGEVVFVETGSCIYNSNMTVNSQGSPGLFILNNGTMKVNGTITWWGVIYAVNAQDSTDTILELSGNSDIRGGAFVDGMGRLSVGNSKLNLTYDPYVTQNRTAFGTAGIIQNTWREINVG
jgi:uncharacterized protein (DUF2141 family)